MIKKILITLFLIPCSIIYVFANDSTSHVKTCNGLDDSVSVFAKDMDSDGDIDVVSASGNSIYLYETINSDLNIKHLICRAENPTSVYASDLDSDGDLDVIVSLSESTLTWFENQGTPSFTFARHTIDASANSITYLRVADMDMDGDSDILTHSSLDGQIKWYENNGDESFKPHGISTKTSAREIIASEIDRDSMVDFLSCTWNKDGSTITLYRNDGLSSPSFTATEIISEKGQFNSLYVADMDNDNDKDVLAYLEGKEIVWYRNNGSTFTKITIATNVDRLVKIYPEDTNNDGDIDVVCQDQHGNITLLENTGTSSPAFIRGTQPHLSLYAESLMDE